MKMIYVEYENYIKHVSGKKKGDILLFALSTCGWCGKTKDLLNELDVDYRYVYVDLLESKAKSEANKEVSKWNPEESFPTIIINKKCIVGFQEEELRRLLE
jgi:glutaredoxin